MQTENNLVERLTESKVYSDYERAFSDATGLPLRLRSVESWQLPHHGQRKENEFCAMLAGKSRACAACLQVQQCLAETARDGSKTVTCAAGLSDTAVPVRLGDRLIGFLHTGQIFRKKPTDAQFERVGLRENPTRCLRASAPQNTSARSPLIARTVAAISDMVRNGRCSTRSVAVGLVAE